MMARIVVFVLALWSAFPLFAHEMGMVRVEAEFRSDGTYVVDLIVDREHVPPGVTIAPIESKTVLSFDGKRVANPKAAVVRESPAVTHLRMQDRMPASASQFTFANGAVTGFFVLTLRNEGDAEAAMQWVEGGETSQPFSIARVTAPRSRLETIKLYLALGFTHILPRGLDHVLFVLGIFLLSLRLKPVLWQVTAFTVAHTITLALTIYGVVSLPPEIVEPLIALSIAYVAIENVLTDKLHAWRPLIVFVFGLLHGMGFAGVLSEIGLPRSEFVPALLSFNAGVELGQLAVIFAAFVLVGLPFRNRPWYRSRIVIPGSLIIACVGMFWFVQRIAGVLGS